MILSGLIYAGPSPDQLKLLLSDAELVSYAGADPGPMSLPPMQAARLWRVMDAFEKHEASPGVEREKTSKVA